LLQTFTSPPSLKINPASVSDKNFFPHFKMYNMKQATLFILSLFVWVACSKKSAEPQPAPIPVSPAVGYWTGSYTTNGQLGSSKYAMLLHAGGTGRVYDLGNQTDTSLLLLAAKPNLVWTISGNTVQTTYTSGPKTVNTTATLNAANNQMSGTWAFDAAVKGNISLSK
jgi:hypothetical protein